MKNSPFLALFRARVCIGLLRPPPNRRCVRFETSKGHREEAGRGERDEGTRGEEEERGEPGGNSGKGRASLCSSSWHLVSAAGSHAVEKGEQPQKPHTRWRTRFRDLIKVCIHKRQSETMCVCRGREMTDAGRDMFGLVMTSLQPCS